MSKAAARGAPSRSVMLAAEPIGQIEVLIDEAAQLGGDDAASSSASAPAIVLLPSSLRDARDLGALASCLAAAGFKVLRPQPRGMGASNAPLAGLTLHHLARDVAATIDALADGRAIVAGHAFGHFIARVTDLDHNHCVRGLVVLAGAARSFPAGLPQALECAADAGQPRATRLAALRHAFFAPGNDASPWLDGWYPQLRDAYRRASATPDKNTWWPVSHAPILDLQGACDPWRPQSTRDELRQVLGDKVTVRIIDDASHALPDEQSAAVSAAIVDWERRLPA
jgi:pimeloyl-ACP methyl ester carboxylesterase